MKRAAGVLVVVASLSGCMSVDCGPEFAGPVGSVPPPGGCGAPTPSMIPGVKGAWGEGVPVAAPYKAPMSAQQAAWMMNHSVPLDQVQMTGRRMSPSGLVQASANVPGGPPPGVAMPPGGLLAPPGIGAMPIPPGMMRPGGPMPPGGPMMAAAGPIPPPGAMPPGAPHRFPIARTQVRFLQPSGMKISWFTMGPDGKPNYSGTPLETPGRYNFLQAAIYRLKLSSIEGRPGLDVYPTLEVVPTNPKTEAFLAHSSVPVVFTNEDFQQISEGNYIVKVIYLPDSAFQEVASTQEIVSTRLEPGADPIKEALRRGSILLVIRMGNVDQEAPNTPPIDAPPPGGGHPMPPMPPGMPMMPPPPMMGPGMPGPGAMVPFTGMGPMGPMGAPGVPMGSGGPMGGQMPPGGFGPMGPMAPGGMGPMGPMAPGGMGPTSPVGPVGPRSALPTGPAAQPAAAMGGVATVQPKTTVTAPLPGTPLTVRDDGPALRQTGAAASTATDAPAPAARPTPALPRPASILAIPDSSTGNR